MPKTRKITVQVPEHLLAKAQQATSAGITETVRAGLRLVAAAHAYEQLRQFRGKFRFSRSLSELKDDR